MKRSEMVISLTATFTNKDRRYEVNQELAELMLNFIEQKGMLPPLSDDTLQSIKDGDFFPIDLSDYYWDNEQ